MAARMARRLPLSAILGLIALSAASFMVASPAPAAVGAGPNPACGSTIVVSTTLTGNVGPCAGNGLFISGNGVSLNCAGYAIIGPGASSAFTGVSLASNESAVNCVVSDFHDGFLLKGANSTVLRLNTASSDGVGFHLVGSHNDTLKSNAAVGDTTGYNLTGTSRNEALLNTLTGNTATNGAVGFFLRSTSNNTLTANSASGGTGNGFVLESSFHNVLSNDFSSKNGMNGFLVTAFSGVANSFSSSEADNNNGYGFSDGSAGSGTAGTGDIYTGDSCNSNVAGGSSPQGLCAPTTVIQPVVVKFSVIYGGAPQTVTVNGCSPSPSTLQGDNTTSYVAVNADCAFTLSLPPRYQFTGGTGTTTCSSGACSTYVTSYESRPPTNVTQPVTASLNTVYGGTRQTISIVGCHPSPPSFLGDGLKHNITISPSCAFGFALPSGYRLVGANGTTTCIFRTCSAFATSYEARPVAEGVKLSVARPGVPTLVKLAGCAVSPTAILADGKPHVITAAADCVVTASLPSGSSARYSAGASTAASTNYTPRLFIKTCSSGTCSTYSHTIYEQFLVKTAASPATRGTTSPAGARWYQAGLTIPVKASPKPFHYFVKWKSSSLIKIASPLKASSTALVNGAGTITALFG